ncbi:hypothetical protein HWV62_4323 [Athelia sp. TMB]|nr:hypothetical protein HWV62_4323 [Athelia sp. TMB]
MHRVNTPQAAITQYLLGMGPMPPITPQQRAVGYAQQALDGGAYENPFQAGLEPAPQAEPVTRLDVQMPYKSASRRPGDNIVVGMINFQLDIPPEDFLSRVCAQIGISREGARLGWKSQGDDKQRAPWHRLETHDDVRQTFAHFDKLKKDPRRRKAVVMEIADLEDAARMAERAAQLKNALAPKATESAYAEELKIVKGALRCEEHGGANRWCYVSPGHGKKHIALGLKEVGLWARKMRVGRQKNTPDMPAVHIHLGSDSPLAPVTSNGAGTSASGTKRPREESSDDESDSDGDLLPITEVLRQLDSRMPALKFRKYEAALSSNGIEYAHSVLDFDATYFKDNVGMSDGASREFLRSVRRIVKGKAKQHKRARQAEGQENVRPAQD